MRCSKEIGRMHFKSSPVRLDDLADEQCPHCGNALPDDRHLLKKYCSDTCRIGFQLQRAKDAVLAAKQGKTCECCGTPIDPARLSRTRFCDRACLREWQKRENRKNRRCRKCHRPIDLSRRSTAVFCSTRCYNLDKSMTHHDRTVHGRHDRGCKDCGGTISGELHLRILYCSRPCKRRADYRAWKGRFRCEEVGGIVAAPAGP